jgi:hypothetical protein
MREATRHAESDAISKPSQGDAIGKHRQDPASRGEDPLRSVATHGEAPPHDTSHQERVRHTLPRQGLGIHPPLIIRMGELGQCASTPSLTNFHILSCH